MNTPLSKYHASLGAKQQGPTQYSLPTTHTVYIELCAAGRQGRSYEGRRMGRREQGEGGGVREQGDGVRKQ